MTETKKARPYWVTDTTHNVLKNICKEKSTTMEGAFKELIATYILSQAKLERDQAIKTLKEEISKEEK